MPPYVAYPTTPHDNAKAGQDETSVVRALAIGTGGAATPEYWQRRAGQGYGPKISGTLAATRLQDELRNVAADIEYIRARLKLSMHQVGDALQATRQAAYNWRAGTMAAPERAARIIEIATALRELELEGVEFPARAAGRKVIDGQNLIEALHAGAEPRAALRHLVSVLIDEQVQRDAVASKVADRASRLRDEDGTPATKRAPKRRV